jgi:probable F420-dependent oxidoreductase
MRVGVRVPSGTPDAASLRAIALAVEELGLDSLWCAAHVAIPAAVGTQHDLPSLGRPTFRAESPFADPFVALAFAAGITSRVRLGTVVVPLMASHPLLLAKQAASLDLVADGRCELGIGAGWLIGEAQALGHPFEHPNGRLAEAIEIMRLAWRDGTFSYRGRFYDFPTIGTHPRPPQGDTLPIWIGGKGPTAERIAAATGAGVVLSRVTPENIAARKARYPEVPLGITQTLDGDDDDWLHTVQTFKDAGTDLFIAIRPEAGLVPDLETLATRVLPRLT